MPPLYVSTTVVLIQSVRFELPFAHAVDRLLEATLAAMHPALLRLFMVGERLVEVRRKFEEFARLGPPDRPNFPAAVNRVNILQPTRILIVVPTLVDTPLGEPRPGTLGYVWSLAPGPVAAGPEHWRILQCAPDHVPDLIARCEAAPTTTDAHVS